MGNLNNQDNKRKNLLIFAGITVFLVVGLLLKTAVTKYLHHNEQIALQRNVAAMLEKDGLMGHHDSLRFMEIGGNISDKKKISDEELEWLTARTRRSLQDNSLKSLSLRGFMAMSLESAHPSTPQQKAKMVDLGTALIRHSEQERNDSDTIFGLKILRGVRDPMAVPAITPLMNDKRPAVQQAVKYALKSCGYKKEALK